MLLVESTVEFEGQSRNVVLRQTTADVIRLRDAVRDEFALSMLLVKSVMKMLFLTGRQHCHRNHILGGVGDETHMFLQNSA